MTTIKSPANFTGRKNLGPVVLTFKDGVAEYDGELSDGARAYLEGRGYGIDAEPRAVEPAGPAVDSRDYSEPTQINDLRDAAVDPREGDFLVPTNAGEADPHGPLVVAPGVHGANQKPVTPGPVGSVTTEGEGDDAKPVVDLSDTARQDEKETLLTQAIHVEQQPVHEAVAEIAKLDPINADQPVDTPKGNSSRDEWVSYARTQGATEAELADISDGGLSRDELRDKYGSA